MLAEPELKKLAGTMSGYADAMIAYREIFTTMSQGAPQYLKTTQELEKFFLTLQPLSNTLYDLSQRGFTLLGRQFWPLSAPTGAGRPIEQHVAGYSRNLRRYRRNPEPI